MKKWISLFVIIMSMFSVSVYAQQSDDMGGLENTCSISGGTWTSTAGGNWACCWADWGCYGCVDGVCKIKCTTPRCRKANSIARPGRKFERVEGLAPAGSKGPVVPKALIKPKTAVDSSIQ